MKLTNYEFILQSILYFGIFLIPYHTISIPVMGSRFDISIFLIGIYSIIFRISHTRYINYYGLLFLLAFILIELIKYLFFGFQPFYRVFSGLIWI